MESGPTYITVTAAADILDCEVDKVYQLLDEHMLRGKREGDLTYVRQEDVAELLRLDMIGIRYGEMVKRMLLLETQVSRLKASVNLLFEVNKLASSRFLEMGDVELQSLYNNIVNELGESEWEVARMLQLAEVFLRITELEIERLNDLMSMDNCWLPFHRLALRLTSYVGRHDGLETSYELQRVRDLLYGGRKNIQAIAILCIENKAQMGPSRKLLAAMAAEDIEAFDVVVKQLAKAKKGAKVNTFLA
jgi:hypothetical protein